jgi:hypothetical protein
MGRCLVRDGLPGCGHPVSLPATLGPRVWLAIAERVYGLGAMAVRTENWQAVRALARQRAAETERSTTPWLRHALTMASRAGHLTRHEDGKREQLSLLSLARLQIDRLDCLRSDGIAPGADVELVTLAQFDLAVALVVISDDGRIYGGNFYPNFARFYSERVIPMVERLVQPDAEVREAIFPRSDADLADALAAISDMASTEGWNYSGFRGFGRDIESWITEHRSSD